MEGPSLLAVTGRAAGIRWSLEGPLTIGRSSASALQLFDEAVSRQHAALRPEGGGWVLRDLGSENGVRLNGIRLAGEARLEPGDVFEVGATSFVFCPDLDYLLAGEEGADVIIAGAPPEPTEERAVTGAGGAEAALLELVTEALEGELDPVRGALLELARRFGAERAFVLHLEEGGRPRVAASFGEGPITVSRTVVERVTRHGKAVVSGDAARDLAFSGGVSLAAGEIRSLLAVPLEARGRILGMLHLDRRARDAYGPAELEALLPGARVLALVLLAHQGILELRRKAKAAPVRPPEVVGESPAFRRVVQEATRAARSPATVLVTGETGTGKEVLARLIHAESARARGPFVAVSCAAIPETLQEGELFGWEKGAFTGAVTAKSGLFEQASGGTLFLDEIQDTSRASQVKLLRALQERVIHRLGASRATPVDVRVVAAASKPLDELVARGILREDLYFRLAVVQLKVPPLRARPEDIAPLAQAFLRQLTREAGLPGRELAPEVLELLGRREWPGNVRELRNVVERLLILAEGEVIGLGDVPPELLGGADRARRATRSGETLGEAVAELEAAMIVRALARTGGVKLAAAEALGISRVTLDAKLERYGIPWPPKR